MRRLALVLALAAAPAALAPRAARAEDAPATDAVGQIKALIAEIDAAEKAKDEGALSSAVKKAPPLYKGTQDSAAKSSLMKAVAGVVKQSKMTTARKDAMAALVETEDGKEAWKHIQSAYPDDDAEDETRWNVDFVKALGALHPDAAIDRLLDTFRKAKQNDLSAAAVMACGGYHKSKQRERILEEIVKAGKNMAPARSTTKNVSQEQQARWAAIEGPIGKALDQLTGDAVGNAAEWFKRFDENKKNVKALFKD
ncbi:MAG: hypothetical protein IT460_10205 [Planctomycetes bacterium]|nr:hypothetical protein [Planctomycetota bacterium]